MHPPDAPPTSTRLLGRSRTYTATDLPARLQHWHAPRANRWERLEVLAGILDVQWLDVAGIDVVHLAAGQTRWIAPGSRWCVLAMDAAARFALEVHADQTVAAAAPQRLRADLLDGAPLRTLDAPGDLPSLFAAIADGQSILLRAGFDGFPSMLEAIAAGDGALFWHPLADGPTEWAALVGRTPQPASLGDYLGRDHALIEAALAGALRGDPERMRWLQHLLARHLQIEETILFPAWLAAGGREGWVRGLCNEHRQLREHLPRLDDPFSQRRFLLLLDGHDEKEEQVVYPDIMARVPADVQLAQQAMRFRG